MCSGSDDTNSVSDQPSPGPEFNEGAEKQKDDIL